MKPSFNVWRLALAALSIAGCATQPKPPMHYMLTVKLQDIYNRSVVMRAPVLIGRPFELTGQNGDVRNTLTGVLKPPVSGKFPLELTVSEWISEQSNERDTTRLELELDKPWSGGPAASFIYLRTVTVSK